MSPIVTSILALISAAPAAISQIMTLYEAVKSDISSDDQATIDEALAAAQSSDASATVQADIALDAASQD